jgi:uncharacterized protein (TIGR03083 family)
MSESPWPTIHAQREALAADLAGLSEEQWKTPSLCTGWTVQDVVGHMTATARLTPGRFFGHFIGSGFNFDKMAAKDIAAETAGGPAGTLAGFNEVKTRTTAPPGPIDAMLGESLIHPEDIRRPLGIKHEYPTDAVVRALDFFKKSNLIIGAKSRIAGLTLRATDTDWSYGSGPEVSGPAHSLLLAMTGRKVAIEDLSGEGVDTLRSR